MTDRRTFLAVAAGAVALAALPTGPVHTPRRRWVKYNDGFNGGNWRIARVRWCRYTATWRCGQPPGMSACVRAEYHKAMGR